jgi:hypothetical protein
LRIFGWFHVKDCFVGYRAEHADYVKTDLLPNLPSFIRRVCSGYALVWGVLRTQSV